MVKSKLSPWCGLKWGLLPSSFCCGIRNKYVEQWNGRRLLFSTLFSHKISNWKRFMLAWCGWGHERMGVLKLYIVTLALIMSTWYYLLSCGYFFLNFQLFAVSNSVCVFFLNLCQEGLIELWRLSLDIFGQSGLLSPLYSRFIFFGELHL